MVKEFCELEVWQIAKRAVVEIYKLTKNFPRQETYGLVDQLRRSANSVCANIAEGFERYHTKDKVRFYYNARGSISECKSHLLIAKELNYIPVDVAKKLLGEFNRAGIKLNNMIASLYKRAEERGLRD